MGISFFPIHIRPHDDDDDPGVHYNYLLFIILLIIITSTLGRDARDRRWIVCFDYYWEDVIKMYYVVAVKHTLDTFYLYL